MQQSWVQSQHAATHQNLRVGVYCKANLLIKVDTVNSGNFVSFLTLIGFFLYK